MRRKGEAPGQREEQETKKPDVCTVHLLRCYILARCNTSAKASVSTLLRPRRPASLTTRLGQYPCVSCSNRATVAARTMHIDSDADVAGWRDRTCEPPGSDTRGRLRPCQGARCGGECGGVKKRLSKEGLVQCHVHHSLLRPSVSVRESVHPSSCTGINHL